ncbi:MAG: OsmC family protein [Desulfatitalea sp.]|nr:OsmC family protein [Desulfatitalea sp.]
MNFKQLHFTNRNGHNLAAQLDLPVDGKPHAYAIFAHCFTCTKNLKAVADINRSLTREGIAVLRFDFTGLGQSEGDFADTNFTTNVSDLIDAAGYLSENYEAPQVLIGHSLGGAAVLQAAADLPSARAVAVIGAPARTDHVLKHFSDASKEIEARGEAEVRLDGRPFRIKKQFLENLRADHMTDTLKNLKRALLILHSPVDNIVGIENAAELFKNAKHPKSFVSLDTADHLLTDPADSRYAGTIIAAWSHRYTRAAKADETRASSDQNPVSVRIGKSGYTTEIIANGHSLVADEPQSAGGENMGPSPYDYLVAGLGACKAMTLRMYADRKKWSLDAVRIGLTHGKIHADDCRACETRKGYLDEIQCAIRLEGDLDTDQRQRLLEIADRCPVHRTLKGEIHIKTTTDE